MMPNPLTARDRWWITVALVGIVLAVTAFIHGGRLPVDHELMFLGGTFTGAWIVIMRFFCLKCTDNERFFLWLVAIPSMVFSLNFIIMPLTEGYFFDPLFRLGIMLTALGTGYIALNLGDER